MSNRIWEFLRHKQKTKFCLKEEEVVVLDQLPKSMRNELRRDMFWPIARMHPMFAGLEATDPHIVSRLCDRSISFASIPSMEDVFARGEAAEYMFFVISGHLEYFLRRSISRRGTSSSTPGLAVPAGEWVSEGALWFENWKHFGWLRAKVNCELLAVNAQSFRRVALVSPSPYSGSVIYKEALTKRVKEDVLKQEDGITRILEGRPSDLAGERKAVEQIAQEAFPEVIVKMKRGDSITSLLSGETISRNVNNFFGRKPS